VARDFGPGNLEPDLRASGIDGTVAVEARSQIDETEDLLSLAAQHRFVRGVVGWLPLVDATVGELIDRYASNPALRGSALSVHEQRRILGETAIEAYAL
jgi:L-fuconolactonase